MAGAITEIELVSSTGGWIVGEEVIIERDGACTAPGDPDYATVEVDTVLAGVIQTFHITYGGNGYSVEDDVPNCPEPEGPLSVWNILAVSSGSGNVNIFT